jgi:uncharacterized membrane protein YtjA (UPF0391 family)
MCPFIIDREGVIMLKWAAIFLVIAVVAAILGFGGIAAGAVEIAKVLFFVFPIPVDSPLETLTTRPFLVARLRCRVCSTRASA